jgi:Lon protease-like protein
MPFEKNTPREEYARLDQPECIDRALQNLLEVSRQIEPVGISNKQDIQAAVIALNFMLAQAYNEVLERDVLGNDPLAEEDFQNALSTLERYIKQHKKESALDDVDTDLTQETDYPN